MLVLSLFFLLLVNASADNSAAGVQRQINGHVKEIKQLISQDRLDDAEQLIRRMHALDPLHPRAFSELVTLHHPSGGAEKVRASLNQIGSPSDPGFVCAEGYLSLFASRYAEAADRFESARRSYEELDHAAGQAFALVGLANARRYQSDKDYSPELLEQAYLDCERARPLLERIKDEQGLAQRMVVLSQIESRRKRYESAERWAMSALTQLERLGDLDAMAKQWNQLGHLKQSMDQPESALAAFDKAAELNRELGDDAALVTTLRRSAAVLTQLDRPEEALGRLDDAVAIGQASSIRLSEAWARFDQSTALRRAGRLPEAADSLRSAEALVSPEENWILRAVILERLGTTLRALGEYGAAEQRLLASFQLASDNNDLRRQSAALHGLAGLSLSIGDLSRSLTRQEQALNIYRTIGNRSGELQATVNLGAIQFLLGNIERSLELLDAARKTATAQNDPLTLGRVLSNLAIVGSLGDSDHHDRALERASEAIRIFDERDPRRAAIARTTAATLHSRKRRFDTADELLNAAQAAFGEAQDRVGEVSVQIARGETLRDRGKLDDALAAFDLAFESAGSIGLLPERWIARAGRASVLERSGRPDAALSDYVAAIDTIESQRIRLESPDLRLRFLAGKSEVYESAIRLSAARGDSASAAMAFHIGERGKARSLIEKLVESRAALASKIPRPLIAREQELLDKIGAFSMQLRSANDDKESERALNALELAQSQLLRLELEIRRADSAYGELIYPRATNVAEIQSILTPGETLLEYYTGSSNSYLWLITDSDVDVYPLPSSEELDSLVDDLLDAHGRDRIQLAGDKMGVAELEAISAAVLPRQLHIEQGDRLIIVPDGALHRVPFGVLRREDRYLIEDHEIVVSPSATILRWLRTTDKKHPTRGFAGLGAPQIDDTDTRFSPLRYAARSLADAAATFPPSESVVLSGSEFTMERIRELPLENYRFIHFATHGWADSDNPRHAGLLTSGGGDDDDFLYLDEILTLRLNAETVVLASCQSGVGEYVRGEGLLGLARAFIFSGAESVMVSQWNVHDRSTKLLMGRFYERIARGDSVSKALREAQLSFLGSDDVALHAPYRWAPFVLVGHQSPEAGNATGTLNRAN